MYPLGKSGRTLRQQGRGGQPGWIPGRQREKHRGAQAPGNTRKGQAGGGGTVSTKRGGECGKVRKGNLSKTVQGPAREEKTGLGPSRGREAAVIKEGKLPFSTPSRQQVERAAGTGRGVIPVTGPVRTGGIRQKRNQTRELVQLKTMYKDLLMKTLARALAPLYEPGNRPRTRNRKFFLYCRK